MRNEYVLGFTSLDQEAEDRPLPITGEFPGWLTGSLLRTAPTRFEVGERTYTHWFDGLAMLHAFMFEAGAVSYSNRFLHSQNFCAAEAQGRIARSEFMTDPCRTLFGRVMSVFNPEPSDNGNVNVTVLGKQIVALTETPMPIRFDAHTLKSLGQLTYDSAVGGQISTAHPHHDGTIGYSYVIRMGWRSAYRFFVDEDGRQRVLAELPVKEPSYLHSFGMSENYLILAEFPLRVNPLRLALSGKPFITNYQWHPELGTLFTVVNKKTGVVEARAKAPACFCFHHVNAFEAGGAIHVDLLAYPDPGIIDRLKLDPLRAGNAGDAVAALHRFSIPLGRGKEVIEVTSEQLCDTPLELPRFDYSRRAGKPYHVLWGVGQSEDAGWWNTILRLDLTTLPAPVKKWQEVGCYPGEPVFVARPGGMGEDDGVLLSVVLDGKTGRSFLLVLDAISLSEVARAVVPHHIPFGFHGNHFPNPDQPDASRQSAPAR